MAARRILRAPEARQDFFDIWAHIARENAPSVADTVLARLYGALEVLAYAPRIGRERAEFAGRPRSFAVRPYVIFYQPLTDGRRHSRLADHSRRAQSGPVGSTTKPIEPRTLNE